MHGFTLSPARSRPGRWAAWTLIVALLVPGGLLLPRKAAAENALQTILTDALYGGAAGLLLGGVLMLVVEKDSRDDTVRWGAVIGTFTGFAYGIYETRRNSEEYSELRRSAPSSVRERFRSTGLDPVFAAWGDSMSAASQNGSTLVASLVRSASPQGDGLTARSEYGRRSW